jgi:hypothetical protein
VILIIYNQTVHVYVANLIHLQADLYKLYNDILLVEDICIHFINEKKLEFTHTMAS